MSKVIVSFILSLVPIWFLGAILLTSPTVCHWDDNLGLPIPVEGTMKQVRDEKLSSFPFGERT
jgi:hypothetical protein